MELIENIYDLVESILDETFFRLEDTCYYEDNIAEEMWILLTGETHSLEERLKADIIESFGLKYSAQEIKRIMIAIIAERSYVYNFYNNEHQYDMYTSEQALSFFDGLDYKDIIKSFKTFPNTGISMIKDAFDYVTCSYLFKDLSYIYLFEQGEYEKLRDINPFMILKIIPNKDKFSVSEIMINKIIDLILISLENGDSKMIETFYEGLQELDDEEIEKTILYMISNVFERFATIDMKEEGKESYKYLIPIIESNSNKDLLTLFWEDENFARDIVILFYNFNECLSRQELRIRRDKYKKQKGDVKTLIRLNPNFQDDEDFFKKMDNL